ncbi:hypothetical protein NQ315_008003 [Exocentrus adspersus]|uniref:Transposase n=1 Tax=Exocentrus adspersus TaxID=1586481 RepID=A0AAV8VF24_9CUCU|nr:hypothetical protein NQ315_008003 [Exocentrus adspersus]
MIQESDSHVDWALFKKPSCMLRWSNEDFLDNLNLLERPVIIFQQDGAPPHNSRGTHQLLDRLFGNRWIGTNGPIWSPPRSPDMTPLDFFLWGLVRNEVYKNKHRTLIALQDCIT